MQTFARRSLLPLALLFPTLLSLQSFHFSCDYLLTGIATMDTLCSWAVPNVNMEFESLNCELFPCQFQFGCRTQRYWIRYGTHKITTRGNTHSWAVISEYNLLGIILVVLFDNWPVLLSWVFFLFWLFLWLGRSAIGWSFRWSSHWSSSICLFSLTVLAILCYSILVMCSFHSRLFYLVHRTMSWMLHAPLMFVRCPLSFLLRTLLWVLCMSYIS